MSNELDNNDIQQEEVQEQNVDLNSGEDELDSFVNAQDETGENATPSDDGDNDETPQDEEETADQKPQPAKHDDGSDDDQGTEQEHEIDPAEKRMKDLRDGYSRVNEKNLELTAKYIKQLERDLDGFEELSRDELQELKEDDPDAYIQYLEELEEKKDTLLEKYQLEQQTALQLRSQAVDYIQNTVAEFAQQIGIVSEDMTQKDYNDALASFMSSEELDKIGKTLRENGVVPADKYETYSLNQLLMAYNHINLPAIKTRARADGHAAVVDNINKQLQKPNSRLAAAPPNGEKYKRRENLSQADVLNMGEDEQDAILQENVED